MRHDTKFLKICFPPSLGGIILSAAAKEFLFKGLFLGPVPVRLPPLKTPLDLQKVVVKPNVFSTLALGSARLIQSFLTVMSGTGQRERDEEARETSTDSLARSTSKAPRDADADAVRATRAREGRGRIAVVARARGVDIARVRVRRDASTR